MPSYGKNDFKESNINYLNKDFASLKDSLMNYAKSYFPNSYRDFNESSPGMMLLEMNAYVGDVLSFYIDQQYREMLLPLAEERRNIINMARMFGYKVKPIVPAYVDLTFSFNADAMSDDASKVDYSTCGTFESGIEVSGVDALIGFKTLDILDFKISSSLDTAEVAETNTDSGLATKYTLYRTVKAVSAKERQITFTIGSPEKFKKITIPDTDVVDIVSCIDSNGSEWYEVDFLAQDRVPIKTHYLDEGRESAYQNLLTGENESLPVPYSLQYIKTTKRFTRETNVDNTTSLIFGNGVLKDGQVVDDGFIDLEQVGIIVPGQTNDLNNAIDPLLGDDYSTLGETPNNTTLTITYRTGGGVIANLPSNSLTNIVSGTSIGAGSADISNLTVSNNFPARGGKDQESVDEIREKAKAFFTTQNRCVTKEDYEARVMNMPAKFGNIAKVYVARNVDGDVGYGQEEFNTNVSALSSTLNNMLYGGELPGGVNTQGMQSLTQESLDAISGENQMGYFNQQFLQNFNELTLAVEGLLTGQLPNIQNLSQLSTFELSGINIYVLAYDDNKSLVGNPMVSYSNSEVQDYVPSSLMTNIKNYLANFKILTDTIQVLNGYIVNFGVFFDVVADQYADKQQVKLNCINKIREYFRVEKMQFNQPIFISKLEYELMDVEGVRAVNHVTVSQFEDYHPYGDGEELDFKTYNYTYDSEVDIDGNAENGISGGFQATGTIGYGYKYDFENALTDGVIRPPLPSSPTVFELKNPNQNIMGKVR